MKAEQRTAFEAFVVRDSRALYMTALGLTGHRYDAEDLLQVALERVARRWGRGAEDNPSAYCRTVLVRLAVDGHRSRSRRPPLLLTGEVPDAPFQDAAPGALSEELLAALRSLPLGQRLAVALRCLDDLSEQQTAAVLGVSIGTVKSQTSKGLARLRSVTSRLDANEEVTQ